MVVIFQCGREERRSAVNRKQEDEIASQVRILPLEYKL